MIPLLPRPRRCQSRATSKARWFASLKGQLNNFELQKGADNVNGLYVYQVWRIKDIRKHGVRFVIEIFSATFSLLENSPTEESRELNGGSNKSENFKGVIRRSELLWTLRPQQFK